MSLPNYDWLGLLARHATMRELISRERVDRAPRPAISALSAVVTVATIALGVILLCQTL
jgi:hypothetical protein